MPHLHCGGIRGWIYLQKNHNPLKHFLEKSRKKKGFLDWRISHFSYAGIFNGLVSFCMGVAVVVN